MCLCLAQITIKEIVKFKQQCIAYEKQVKALSDTINSQQALLKLYDKDDPDAKVLLESNLRSQKTKMGIIQKAALLKEAIQKIESNDIYKKFIE